jgi:hypothetical protein
MKKLKVKFKDGFVNAEEVREFVELNGDKFEEHFMIDSNGCVRLIDGAYNPGEDESIVKQKGQYKIVKN